MEGYCVSMLRDMLRDMLKTSTVFKLVISDRSLGMVGEGMLNGNTIRMHPMSVFKKHHVDFFGVFMHEFVGHGHPMSPNSMEPSRMGSNIIGSKWGAGLGHDHNVPYTKKPGGGYLGYPTLMYLPRIK